MRLFTKSGDSMSELVKFINERGIQKDDIVSLGETKDGIFILVYYAKD